MKKKTKSKETSRQRWFKTLSKEEKKAIVQMWDNARKPSPEPEM